MSLALRGWVRIGGGSLFHAAIATDRRPKRVTPKQGTRMKNPRCLVAAPVLAGRTQITALGKTLVACVFLVLAAPVARVQAQTDAPTPNAAASFVSGHLKCVAYYATMSDCLSPPSKGACKAAMSGCSTAVASLIIHSNARSDSSVSGKPPPTSSCTPGNQTCLIRPDALASGDSSDSSQISGTKIWRFSSIESAWRAYGTRALSVASRKS